MRAFEAGGEPVLPVSSQSAKVPFAAKVGAVVSVVVAAVVFFFVGRLTAPSGTSPSPSPGGAQCMAPEGDGPYCPFQVVDDLAGTADSSLSTLSGIPYLKGSRRAAPFPRIEWETVTVDDMSLAVDFYSKMLGGVEVDFCGGGGVNKDYCVAGGGVRFSGEHHKLAMFGYEMSKGEDKSVAEIGGANGYEVHSRFFVFGNGVVQLVQFAGLHNTPADGTYLNLREQLTSPCWIGAGHIDWWIDDDLDMNDYIESAEEQGKKRGMVNVAWNRPVVQANRADRARVPKSQYANKVPAKGGGAFGGLEWAYFKGVVGEQMELYKITDTMKEGIGRAYCDRGAVSPAFVEKEKSQDKDVPLTAKMHGVFQFGYRTDNLDAAVGFYTEVMGGDLISYPTHGINIHDDSAHWMILANETIEAYEKASRDEEPIADAMEQLGVANFSTHGPMRLDHRFILFDNFVVEPLHYTRGLSVGGEVFAPRWKHSTSPAYIGAVSPAFGISTNVYTTLQDALGKVQALADERGFPSVWIPTTSAGFPDDHPFSGLEYSYGKGQAGESLAFVHVAGTFEKSLKAAFEKAGHVSTRFDSTNAFKDGRMDKFCKSVLPNFKPQAVKSL